MSGLSGVGVRVLLLGTATHPGPTLTSVPSVRRSAEDLRVALLTRCGVPAEALELVLDPADAREMAAAVTRAAQQAETVLVVYFIGHGLLGPGDELYLAASSTDSLTPGLAEHQALSFAALRQAVGATRAASVVVVLDCCFSGRAALGPAPVVPAFSSVPAEGFSLLGSAEQLAQAAPDAQRTAFTGALLDVLERGDPRGQQMLTLDAVYDAVFQRMDRANGPLPRRQAGDRSGSLVLAPNPAALAHPTPAVVEQAQVPCPYPGLAAFSSEDARWFFGRETMTRRLLDAVADRDDAGGPLVVVGASGSGKTSLLNAGFLTALRTEGLPDTPGSAGWPRVRLTPGAHPLRALAGRLGGSADAVERLRSEPTHAVELARRLVAEHPEQRVVVLVDQLEELFTLCSDAIERTAFLRAVLALAATASDGPAPAVVVMALRADFYGQAAGQPELVPLLRDRQVLVDPMTPDELRAAIERPAAATGLALDAGLPEVVLHELGVTVGGLPVPGERATSDVLPLLSHALWETWRRREGARLTVPGYRQAGGITQAIATSAENVYDALDEAGRQAARRMLPRLVRVGDDGADTAQPVGLAALEHGEPDPVVARAVLHAFAAARLLTLDRDSARISHEALLRVWQRLKNWVDADRDWLRTRQRLTDDAFAWDRSGQDSSLLYRGTRLAALTQRAAEAPQGGAALEPGVAAFVHASHQQERRRVRRRRVTVAALVALLLLTAAGAGLATWQGQLAARQRDLLASKSAGQAGDRLRSTDPTLAMQLALAAHAVADTPEARTSLLNASLAPYATTLTGHTNTVGRVVRAPGRPLLASNSLDRTVRLWDVTDPDHARQAAVLSSGGQTDVVFRPDGQLLAAGSVKGGRALWDVADPDHPTLVATLPGAHGALAFRPDGRLLASVGSDWITLWDLTDPHHPVPRGAAPVGTSDVRSASISADGRTLAAAVGPPPGDDQGAYQARLWDISDPDHPAPDATLPDTHAFVVAFSPKTALLAVGGNAVGAALWDTTDPARPTKLATGGSDLTFVAVGTVAALAFSQDGRSLAVGVSGDTSTGNRIDVVDLADPNQLTTTASYPTPTLINSVTFGPEPGGVFSSGSDSVIHAWHPALATALPKALNLDLGPRDWGYTPDGHVLALARDPSGAGFQLWRTSQHSATAAGVLPSSDNLPEVVPVNNTTLLTADGENPGQLWDITDPDHPAKAGTVNPVDRLGAGGDVATNGRVLVASGKDGQAHLWDVTDPRAPRETGTLPTSDHPGGLNLSDDGNFLLVIDQGGGVDLWDITAPTHPTRAAHLTVGAALANLVGQFTRGPGKRDLLVISTTTITPHEVQLWDLTDPHHPARADFTPGNANEYAVSPDGRTLAAATDSTIDLWDVSDIHHPTRTTSIPAAASQAQLTFSPDNHLLASTSRNANLNLDLNANSELHVWDVTDRHHATEVASPTLPGMINAMAFAPGSDTLLVNGDAHGNARGLTRLLDLRMDDLTRRTCDAVGRTPLTPDQWQQYLPGTSPRSPCD